MFRPSYLSITSNSIYTKLCFQTQAVFPPTTSIDQFFTWFLFKVKDVLHGNLAYIFLFAYMRLRCHLQTSGSIKEHKAVFVCYDSKFEILPAPGCVNYSSNTLIYIKIYRDFGLAIIVSITASTFLYLSFLHIPSRFTEKFLHKMSNLSFFQVTLKSRVLQLDLSSAWRKLLPSSFILRISSSKSHVIDL